MTKIKTRDITLGALMLALTAICAQIMLPIGPVQFSLQVLAVFLTAALLPPTTALLSMTAYLLLGAIGAPIFGGFRGGPSVLFGVTGGFILAFPLMAVAISWLRVRFDVTKPLQLWLLMSASLVICYTLGCGWFCIATGTDVVKAIGITTVPFVIPDLLKAAVAAGLTPVLSRLLRASQ